jgi:uncharacterized LabA/DUF88 family protein
MVIGEPADLARPVGGQHHQFEPVRNLVNAIFDRHAGHGDHIVLFSGDGDFKPLVESLQRQGVRVSVVSTIRSQPPMIADELRRQADNFIELDELREVIGRPPREPRGRGERDGATTGTSAPGHASE